MYHLTIQLQSDSKKCLYEQIYEHIRHEIKEGKLLAGERLPSTRSLAEYLQVSRSTVDFAYDQLLGEGYIEARPYRGYFVCSLEGMYLAEEERRERNATEKVAEKAAEKAAEKTAEKAVEKTAEKVVGVGKPAERYRSGFCRQVTENGEASAVGETKYTYRFSPHGMDMSYFPFSVWKKITKNILSDSNQELFSQGSPQGDEDLRVTISRYLHSSRGVNCMPEQIVIGAGNDYLLLLLEKILGPGRRVGMDDPTYVRAHRIFQSMGYELPVVENDSYGMTEKGLREAGVDVAYVMPSHQYPSGVVMPISRRAQLLAWAGEGEERYLVEDDYDSEFRYRGKPIPSLQSNDLQGKVIYVGTFSKAIAPAIRVSYMVLPPLLLERYYRQCSFFSCTVSRIDQRILNEFIRDGYFERYLNKMRKVYGAKHQLMLEGLASFQKRFRITGDNAGLHLVLTAKGNESESDLIRKAAEKGVKVYGMSENRVGTGSEKAAILLGFGGLSEEEIREGLQRLGEAWL